MASDMEQWLSLPHADNEASRRGIQQWRLHFAGDLPVVAQHGGEHHVGESQGHGVKWESQCGLRSTYAILGTRMSTYACGAREQDVVMAALWDPPTRLGAKFRSPVNSTNVVLRKPRFKGIGHFHPGDAELNVLTNSGGGVPQVCKADGNPPDEVGTSTPATVSMKYGGLS
ncbi:hypothetical protein LI328DRAFT_156530 [Trichoderma asperelloides]|nr:hypothetical protein LI328DRAFT_156530 [Trichoderma asperelloides]